MMISDVDNVTEPKMQFFNTLFLKSFHGSGVESAVTRTSYELTPEQANLVTIIDDRNLAIAQQNFQIAYWSDSSNSLAGDRVLAQDRIDRARDHIAQTTIQRDSLQAQLDQLTG